MALKKLIFGIQLAINLTRRNIEREKNGIMLKEAYKKTKKTVKLGKRSKQGGGSTYCLDLC